MLCIRFKSQVGCFKQIFLEGNHEYALDAFMEPIRQVSHSGDGDSHGSLVSVLQICGEELHGNVESMMLNFVKYRGTKR